MIARPLWHGISGPYDEVIAVVGLIVFVGLLIHLLFFEGRPQGQSRPGAGQDRDDDRQKRS
jgi:hypothetical protein